MRDGAESRRKQLMTTKKNGQSMKGKVTVLINFAVTASCVHSDTSLLSQWCSPSTLSHSGVVVLIVATSTSLWIATPAAASSAPFPFLHAYINIFASSREWPLHYFQCQFPAWLAINRINAWQKKEREGCMLAQPSKLSLSVRFGRDLIDFKLTRLGKQTDRQASISINPSV